MPSQLMTASDLSASQGEGESSFYWSRIGFQWKSPLSEGLRVELDLNQTQMGSDSSGDALGLLVDGGQRLTQSSGDMLERSSGLTAKLRRDGEQHEQVFGFEWSLARREELRSEIVDGRPSLLGSEENVTGRSERLALYAQNEWNPSPQWTLMTGIRQERMETSGGSVGSAVTSNTAQVTTPLMHVVFRPVPKGSDLIRLGLTRGYKAANLRDFIAAPNISDRYPVSGENSFVSPDRAGNPGLKPELAVGLDLAFERSLPQRGLLSASLFARELTDFQRRQTLLESVSWSPVPRWVSRLRNLGKAQTYGVELEARVAAGLLGLGWKGVELRPSVSAYTSSVEGIPGPNNRLDQQPGLTAKLGIEQRLGAGGQWGSNLSYTQGGRVQVSEQSWSRARNQWRLDAFWLTRLTPKMRLRVSGQDLLSWGARTETGTVLDGLEQRSIQSGAGEARLTIGLEGQL
jgi:iron complex outermembrane receptor protein